MVDADTVLRGVISAASTSNRVLISTDPNATVSEIETPSSSYSAETLAVYVKCGSGTTSSTIFYENLNIPIQKGTTLFGSFSGVGSAVLLLEDVI